MNDPLDPNEPAPEPLAPRDRERYLERIDRYRRECGCASGAMFIVAALVICLVIATNRDWGEANLLVSALLGVAFVTASGAIGKLFGIALARIKLALLYGSMRRSGILAELGLE